ncbi:MAG: ribonuclease III [Myxococcales bacterium]|nr:ribonuclease III [Myxococcales bacterium]
MERLGYQFDQLSLLDEAFTHRSYSNENRQVGFDNERLEFLGDSILGAAVADLLMVAHPSSSEGILTRYKATLVSETALAECARRMKLGELLRLGRGEEQTGGRDKSSVLANLVEAVIAAVFIDGGYPAARGVVERFVEARLPRVGRVERRVDYKTKLQVQIQGAHRGSPIYVIVDVSGPDHERTFIAEVRVDGLVLGSGRGGSKKIAEQAAAREAFRRVQESNGTRPEFDSVDSLPGLLL